MSLLVVPVTARPPGDAPSDGVYRVGVVSFYNPRLMYLKYQPLVDYLSEHTPWRFELDLLSSYRDTVSGLCSGRLTLAYFGPFTYLRAHEACGARLLVRLHSGGQPTFRAYIMVREDSPVRTLADLRGKAFGFGAVLSTSSHLMPRAMLEQGGLRPGVSLPCRYYGHHERAARGVLVGEVAACGVRDQVGEVFKGRGLRVLAQSEPMTNFPFAVTPGMSPEMERVLAEALVDLPRRDPEAARTISSWDAELSGGFARAKHEDYASVAALATKYFGPRSLSVPPDQLACPER